MTPRQPSQPVRVAFVPMDKRDAILDAALGMFTRFGFHGSTIPQVAADAGVGAGTVYRYFESKEAIVNALYQKLKGDVVAMVMKDFPVDKPARQMVHHLWSRLAEFALGDPRAFAFLELHHHADYLDESSRAIEHRILEFGVRLIEAAQKRGEVKAGPPMLLISVLHGAFTGMVRMAWEGRLELDADRIALAEQCAWEAIRA